MFRLILLALGALLVVYVGVIYFAFFWWGDSRDFWRGINPFLHIFFLCMGALGGFLLWVVVKVKRK